MALRETENNTYAKFWVTNKELYGMLCYFLGWLIDRPCRGFGRHDDEANVSEITVFV